MVTVALVVHAIFCISFCFSVLVVWFRCFILAFQVSVRAINRDSTRFPELCLQVKCYK